MSDINWEKKVYSGGGKIVTFDEAGDETSGILLELRHGTTRMGDAIFADFRDLTTKQDVFTIILSSGLVNSVTDKEIGKAVKIVFLGMKKNEKSGRNFKAFDVFTAENENLPLTEVPDEVVPF